MPKDVYFFPKSFRLEEVSEKINALKSIFKERGVRAAYLYGSLAEEGRGGDADLAVLFKDYSFSIHQQLYDDLSRLFLADNIDLLPLNRASFLLRKRIVLCGVPLYEEEPDIRRKLIEELLAQLEDHRFLAEMVEVELRKRVEGGLSMAKREPDKERVKAYLSKLDEAVGQLKSLSQAFSSFDDFMSRVNERELSVHYLRIALECVLDVCRHFVAIKGVSLSEVDTANIIELAGEKGLIPFDFAKRIRGMVGMRNAIVHLYLNLDYQAVYEAITKQLPDFNDFSRYVLAYLDKT